MKALYFVFDEMKKENASALINLVRVKISMLVPFLVVALNSDTDIIQSDNWCL